MIGELVARMGELTVPEKLALIHAATASIESDVTTMGRQFAPAPGDIRKFARVDNGTFIPGHRSVMDTGSFPAVPVGAAQ